MPQRKIPFMMPGQWLVNRKLEQMELKRILLKHITKYEELECRSVTASAEDNIILSPLTFDL